MTNLCCETTARWVHGTPAARMGCSSAGPFALLLRPATALARGQVAPSWQSRAARLAPRPPQAGKRNCAGLKARAACHRLRSRCRSAFTKDFSVLFLSDGTATATK